MRFNAFSTALIIMTLLLPLSANAQRSSDSSAAEAFIDKVAAQGLDTIKSTRAGKLSEQQAKVNFREILNNAFDVPTIARFTLGKYWRVATPAQQTEYTRLLRTGILDKYADRVLSYSGNTYKITQTKAINDTDYGVNTTIERGDQPSVDFTWRLRRIGGTFKVIDLSVEGISMSVTHRSDFASLIERNGGQVEALLKALRNKEITAGE